MGKDESKKKILSDDDKIMRDAISKEMLKKIERRIDNQDESAVKTIQEMLKRADPKKPEKPKKKPKI